MDEYTRESANEMEPIEDVFAFAKKFVTENKPLNLPGLELSNGLFYEMVIYFLCDDSTNVIYVGRTNNLLRRIHEHWTGRIGGKYKKEFKYVSWFPVKESSAEFAEHLFIALLLPKYNARVPKIKQWGGFIGHLGMSDAYLRDVYGFDNTVYKHKLIEWLKTATSEKEDMSCLRKIIQDRYY